MKQNREPCFISRWKIHWVVCKNAFTSLSMQKKTRNVSSCRRKVTELGRDWKNKSSVSSMLTLILASSSSIPCKRCEKPTGMVVYKYTRTEQKRLFEFFHDDDDGDDDDIDISELFHWGIPQTSSSSSSSSLRSLEGSKHGRSVATGNPPPNPTGPAPNPCEDVGA